HTIFSRDWSSDVCSSDLVAERAIEPAFAPRVGGQVAFALLAADEREHELRWIRLIAEPHVLEHAADEGFLVRIVVDDVVASEPRSQERRGGKEGVAARWA